MWEASLMLFLKLSVENFIFAVKILISQEFFFVLKIFFFCTENICACFMDALSNFWVFTFFFNFFFSFCRLFLVSNFHGEGLFQVSVILGYYILIVNLSWWILKDFGLNCMVVQVSQFLSKRWCMGGVSSWDRFMRGKLNLLEG